MPHHRTLSPPARRGTTQRGAGEPVVHAELRRHYDAVYDLLLDGRRPRDAGPLLDIGTGDGAAIGAIAMGTGLRGVGVDLRTPSEWLGPPDWEFVEAPAERLPFDDGSFRTALFVDVIEWLRRPEVALAEASRVTDGPIVIVQTDWDGLWFETREADAARELSRLYLQGSPDGVRKRIRDAAAEAGLQTRELSAQTIRADSLAPGSLASDVLNTMRRWLVIDAARVRARRFDDWRTDLELQAADGHFSMLIRRWVGLFERGQALGR